MKIIKKIRVKNKLGLHVRPAAMIAKMLQNMEINVVFRCKNQLANAKSVMSILSLTAKKNSDVIVFVEGENAGNIMLEIERIFAKEFE